jgi:hypothetical protein
MLSSWMSCLNFISDILLNGESLSGLVKGLSAPDKRTLCSVVDENENLRSETHPKLVRVQKNNGTSF